MQHAFGVWNAFWCTYHVFVHFWIHSRMRMDTYALSYSELPDPFAHALVHLCSARRGRAGRKILTFFINAACFGGVECFLMYVSCFCSLLDPFAICTRMLWVILSSPTHSRMHKYTYALPDGTARGEKSFFFSNAACSGVWKAFWCTYHVFGHFWIHSRKHMYTYALSYSELPDPFAHA
jgi:hypothetical protein